MTSSSEQRQQQQAINAPIDVQEALQVLYEGGGESGPVHLCIITTGAGGHIGAWMLGTPGASNVLVELSSPYSYGAISEYIGRPAKEGAYCSHSTTIELAQVGHFSYLSFI